MKFLGGHIGSYLKLKSLSEVHRLPPFYDRSRIFWSRKGVKNRRTKYVTQKQVLHPKSDALWPDGFSSDQSRSYSAAACLSCLKTKEGSLCLFSDWWKVRGVDKIAFPTIYPPPFSSLETQSLICSIYSMYSLFSAPQNSTLVWRAESRSRGSFNILSTCLIVLVSCVWTAVHLNVPKYEAPTESAEGLPSVKGLVKGLLRWFRKKKFLWRTCA
jgi:hypothetical protein